MTPDQEQRLIAAVQNYSDLIDAFHGPQDVDAIEALIEILNGQAGQIEKGSKDNHMARGRKKKDSSQVAPNTAAPSQPQTIEAAASHVSVPSDRTQLITEWKQAADQLKEFKAKENALRQALVAQISDATKLEGTETIDIGWGYSLKVVKEMNYTATNKNSEVESLIELLSSRGEAAEKLAGDLISWKPDVAKKAYREVLRIANEYNDQEILKLLHESITVKPGLPQLEMVGPGQAVPESPSTANPPVYVLEQNFSPE